MSDFNGIVRQVDPLGRIVIPKEIRKQLDITDGEDCVEMQLNDMGELILKKHKSGCIFCGGASFLVSYKGSLVCRDCIENLNQSDT